MRRLVVCRVESTGPEDPPGKMRLRPLASWPADPLNAPPKVRPWRSNDILDDLKRYEAEKSKPKEPT